MNTWKGRGSRAGGKAASLDTFSFVNSSISMRYPDVIWHYRTQVDQDHLCYWQFAFVNVPQDWTRHFGSHIKNLLSAKTPRSVSHELLLNQVSPTLNLYTVLSPVQVQNFIKLPPVSFQPLFQVRVLLCHCAPNPSLSLALLLISLPALSLQPVFCLCHHTYLQSLSQKFDHPIVDIF